MFEAIFPDFIVHAHLIFVHFNCTRTILCNIVVIVYETVDD